MSETSGIGQAFATLLASQGGLPGLLQKFQDSGLSNVVATWVSNEQENHPINPAQVHEALGGDAVREAADASGMSTGDLVRQLAQHLPQLVNHMTPEGQVQEAPANSWMTAAISYFTSR